MGLSVNNVNEFGVPLHACNGYRHDEHYWAWINRMARIALPGTRYYVRGFSGTWAPKD